MIRRKGIGIAAVLLMAAALVLLALAYLNPTALPAASYSVEAKYVSTMDKTQVLEIQILAAEEDWASMLENAAAEEYIPATVVINGTTIENVGIRPKGNSSLSMVAQDETTDRYSFKIEFDHYIEGQTWLGLDKLAVNNMQGDASYLKEYLSYDIMRYIGVDAPLCAFADISVNGETWGFYLAVEALEESFATRVYGSGHGALYKPESMGMRGEGRMNVFVEGQPPRGENRDAGAGEAQGNFTLGQGRPQGQFQGPMPTEFEGGAFPPQEGAAEGPEGGLGGLMLGGMGGMSSGGVALQYTDDDPESYSAIFENAVFDTDSGDERRVVEALKKLSLGEDLENTVDVEAVLRYFAAHTVSVNMDSYVSNMGHNYYLYEKDGQLTILPWDYNLAFGGFQSGGVSQVVNFPIDTPVSGVSLADRPLLGKLLEVPAYLELYHSYLSEIVTGYFERGAFVQTMDQISAIIAPYVEKDPSAFYDFETFEHAVSALQALCLLRAESIRGQLDGSIPSTTEGQQADSGTLVDTSGLDLATLGSQGLGGMVEVGGAMPQGQAVFGGQRPGDMDEPGNVTFDPAMVRQGAPGQTESLTAGDLQEELLLLGGALLLLFGGLAFTLHYKRRGRG